MKKCKIQIDYEKEIKKKRLENIKIFKDALNNLNENKNIEEKLLNWCERYDYDFNELISKLNKSDDILVIGQFAKDPGKQNMHEDMAFEYLQKLPVISNQIHLPKGKNAKFVVNGKITDNKGTANIKSLDCYFCYEYRDKKLEFYTSNKYTKSSGGAQDNQFNDLQEFMKQARDVTDKNIFLMAVADGDYYQNKYEEFKTKIEYFNERYKGTRVIALTSNEILETAIIESIKWLNENFDDREVEIEINRLNKIFDEYYKS